MTKVEIIKLVTCLQTDAWAMAGFALISFEHYITGIAFVLLALGYHIGRDK